MISKLVDIYSEFPGAAVYLWELLKDRTPDQSISHKAMPGWDEHFKFVLSRPYLAWYLVYVGDSVVGAVYLSERREIGIGILREFRGSGYGKSAVQELMRLHPGKFLANINPANAGSAAMFQDLLGFKLIQHTYELA